MSEEETIHLKKSTLWKVATGILAVAFVVVLVVAFSGGNGTGKTVAPTGQDAVNLNVFLDNPDLFPSLGPDDAKNVVIEFADFQCPYCAMASGLPSWVSQYQDQYGDLIGTAQKLEQMGESGQIKFVYVPMSFLGAESGYTSEAGYCANEQGKFWEMHDTIFAAHDSKENNGKYTKENLKLMAQTISGLDQAQFADCLDSSKYASTVQEANSKAGTAASGTPTFYVNGVKMSGSWQQISAALA